jgi:hypothetical protein
VTAPSSPREEIAALRVLAEKAMATHAEGLRIARLSDDERFSSRAYFDAIQAAQSASEEFIEALSPEVVGSLLDRVETAERLLEDVSFVAERFVDTDVAHDQPEYAVSIMGQMIDAARATPSGGTTDGPRQQQEQEQF